MQELLTMLTLLSTVVTTIVEGLRSALDENKTAPKWVWGLSALGLGVMVALFFRVNFFLEFEVTKVATTLGRVLTGLVIGGGSNVVHRVLGLAQQKEAHLKAEKESMTAGRHAN